MFNTKSNNKKFIFLQTVKVCIDLNLHIQKTSQEPVFFKLIILIQISMPVIPHLSRLLCIKWCARLASLRQSWKKSQKSKTKIENDEKIKSQKHINKILQKPGGVNSGDYHEDGELVVMAMASIFVKIHCFLRHFLV